MPLPTGDVIGILGDNLRLRKSVLPLPTKVATKWTEGLGLPKGGETVLYTGMMYQIIPYISSTASNTSPPFSSVSATSSLLLRLPSSSTT